MPELSLMPTETDVGAKKKCRSCGTSHIGTGRRYCSKECRQQMAWVLSLSNGLLKAFNARYAAFSFDNSFVVLDVLPVWSRQISRFLSRRTSGKKPADDLKRLILRSGDEWYRLVNNRTSKSYASLYLLQRNHNEAIAPESIKPDERKRPRLTRQEKDSMKLLKLKLEELFSAVHVNSIKRAYKQLAKVHHPDVGGDAEKFKRLNDAHQHMLLWAENPHFTSRKALTDCWSYDGATNRWSPPI
ncbi:MAG: J domain-containing protein [Desulfatiglandales bacterium]